jgi:hypothetical protein
MFADAWTWLAAEIERAPVAVKVTAGAQQLLVDDNVFRRCAQCDIVYVHPGTARAEERNNTCQTSE